MPLDQTANFVRATLASAIAAGDSTIALADSGQLVDPANGEYNLILWNPATYPRPGQDPAVEIVRATALDSGTDTLTVDRGQEGTAAADHAVEAVLQLTPTAKMFSDIDSKTSALSADGQTFAGDAIDVGSASVNQITSNTNSFQNHTSLSDVAEINNTNWNDVLTIESKPLVGEVTIMCPDGTVGNRGGITKAYFIHTDNTLVDPILSGTYKGFSTRWDSNTLQIQPDKDDTNYYIIKIDSAGNNSNLTIHI